MKTTTGFIVLLLGLPLGAAAETDPKECTQLALRFSSEPRGMAIRELDALRTCINEQRLALEYAEQDRQAARAGQ